MKNHTFILAGKHHSCALLFRGVGQSLPWQFIFNLNLLEYRFNLSLCLAFDPRTCRGIVLACHRGEMNAPLFHHLLVEGEP